MYNNQCYKCKHFDKYYTKGVKHFNKTNFGWCREIMNNVTIHDFCDRFVLKPRTVKSNRLLKHCLNDLLTEISEIRKRIEEDNESII